MLRPSPPRFARALAANLPALGLAWSLAATPAHAQPAPKDADTEKALEQAMGTDYLETKFDQAEQRLRAAIDACGADGCSSKLKARLYMALGTVLAHGKKQLEDARDAFVEGLGLDPEAKPDPDLMSAEISFAFEQARAAFGLAGVKSGLDVKPPPEQRVRTPLPVYAEIRADLLERTKQVTIWYQPPSGGEHRSLLLKKLRDRGYGINLPCTDLVTQGTVRYYLLATDADGAILASAGSRDQPLTTSIKETISTPPPSWPGFAPPQPCAALEQGKPSQCLDNRQCNEGLTCVAGACVPKAPEAPVKDVRRNWVSISFWPDVSLFSGEGVCSRTEQAEQHFVCLRQDGTRYDGVPTANAANNVNLGFALGTLRVALAYDRLLLDNVSAGARVGFAFNGAKGGGASFLPVHVEVRGQYFLLPPALDGTGVRPYGLVSAGLAQIDSRVEVEVLEDGVACGADPNDATSPCTVPSPSGVVEERSQFLDAYKQAGLGFASAGVGLMYEPAAGMALNVALRASVTFPVVTAVLSPELGFALGF
jgi:hypothetical protein